MYGLFPLRPTFMASSVVFMLGSLVGDTAPSSLVFVVSRAVCELATAGVTQGCFYMLVHIVPLRKRPLVVGFLNGVEALANISSPSIGGLIVGSVSWRWCFWINLPVGALSLAITFFALRIELKSRSFLTLRQRLVELDLVGNVLFVPSLTSLFLALSWAGTKYPWNSGTVIGLLVTFAVLLALFSCDQRRRGDKATLPPRILGNRSVLAGFVFASCTNAAMNVFEYYLPTYFQSVRAYAPTKSGYLMLPLLAGYLVAMLAHERGRQCLGILRALHAIRQRFDADICRLDDDLHGKYVLGKGCRVQPGHGLCRRDRLQRSAKRRADNAPRQGCLHMHRVHLLCSEFWACRLSRNRANGISEPAE